MLEVVFHPLNHAAFFLGRATSTTVTPLGFVGVHKLDALVFLLGCEVSINFWHLFGGDAVFDDVLHLHHLVELVNLHLDDIAFFHFARRFDGVAVHLHLAALDGIGSQKLALLYMDGTLWLGKRIDNVFVFKYAAYFLCEVVEGTNIFKAKNVQDGEYKRMEVTLSKDKCVKAINGRNEYIFDFKLFNDKTLEAIFGDAVKRGDVHWNYVTADYLSKKYVVKEWLVY